MTNAFIEYDLPLLKKYKDGEDLDEKDEPRLRELASIGLINFGISIKRQKITVKTTGVGIGLTGL
jgi:hypothetical protein